MTHILCVACDKYFNTDKAIRSHLLSHMTTAERENHFRANASGSWIYTAPSTKWCVALTLPNTVRSRLVPVSREIATVRIAVALVPAVASSTVAPTAAAHDPPPAPATAPALDQSFKCCCGLVFQTLTSLKRHHDGAPHHTTPGEPAHPCTAGCTFPSRARK